MKVLLERGSTHGDFEEGATVERCLKDVLRGSRNWVGMTCAQQMALEMICHKMARILVGDPNFLDSYRDIAGYAQLAFDCTAKLANATDVTITRSRVNEQL